MRLLFMSLALASGVATAQHQPYSGQETRDIKALSGEEVKQYLSGAGMGYARAAELNHFPGPMHALELSDRLKLTPEQREATERLMDAHKAEARAIGARLVDAERVLDALFRSATVSQATLRPGGRHGRGAARRIPALPPRDASADARPADGRAGLPL